MNEPLTLEALKEKERRFNQKVTVKECSKCHRLREFKEFSRSKKGSSGYLSKCKECMEQEQNEYTEKMSEEIYPELLKLPENKTTFTIQYISNRLKINKSTISTVLKLLNETGKLQVNKDDLPYRYYLPTDETKQEEAIVGLKDEIFQQLPLEQEESPLITFIIDILKNNSEESITLKPETHEIIIKLKEF